MTERDIEFEKRYRDHSEKSEPFLSSIQTIGVLPIIGLQQGVVRSTTLALVHGEKLHRLFLALSSLQSVP